MDNQEPINPDGIISGSNQNIPISPNIPYSSPDLSTGQNQAPVESQPIQQTGANAYTPPAEPEPMAAMPMNNPAVEEPKPITMPSAPKTMKPINKRLIAGILTGVGLLAIIAFGIYYFVFLKGGANVTISSSQSAIDLVIDGTEYTGVTTPYTIKISLGDHSITARKDGFSDMSKPLSVTNSGTAYTLAFDLQTKPTPNQLLSREAFFPAYSKDTRIFLFFDKATDGYTLKEYNLDTKEETSLVENIYDVTKVAWSPSYKQLAVKVINSAQTKSKEIPFLPAYGEGTRVNWIINLERKDLVNITTKSLNPTIKNISFNPLGTKIAYLYEDDTQRILAVANPDGSNYERLYAFETIEFEPDIVWSPDGSELSITANEEGDVFSKAQNPNVFVYSFQTKAIIKVSTDGVSYGALFSPDGRYITYNSGNTLSTFDLSNTTDGYTGIKLNIESGTSSAIWMNNQSMIIMASDKSLYRVNVSGTKELIDYNGENITGNIKGILPDDGTIFIISNGGVYQLSIAQGV